MTNVIELPNKAGDTLLAQRLQEEADQAVKVSQSKETPPTVRTVARKSGVDLQPLINILSWQRPANSEGEEEFVQTYLAPIEGMKKDDYGNYYLTIGDSPSIMWSCHTDTVAYEDGKQNVKWDGNFLVLNQPDRGQCLGADDGAGLWLLLEMINAKVPGLYIFHREEEIGGQGSRWIAKNAQGLIENIDVAIAFDRRDVSSIITHQGGRRTSSDKFGNALGDKLSQVEGLTYKLDTGGSFTDTKSYVDLIAECTNVSVGYYNEHSDREKLDVAHLLRLREALITQDFADLPVERDPSKTEYDSYGSGYGSYSRSSYGSYGGSYGSTPKTPVEELREIIQQHPYAVSQMLFNMGMTPETFKAMTENVWRRTAWPKKEQEVETRTHSSVVAEYLRRIGEDEREDEEPETLSEERLWCNSCSEFCDEDGLFGDPRDGDWCPGCDGRDTELIECEVDGVTGDVVQ